MKGFTLIEMLVAVTLMAVMGIVCWRGLAFVANQRASIEVEALELANLVRAFAQIERDLAERLPDTAAPARATTPELPLAISIAPGANDSIELEILRTVPDHAAQSHALHVLYRLEPRGLVRQTASGEVLVLPGVARLQIRIFSSGFWIEPAREPPSSVRPFGRANALEIAVEDGRGARYVKVLAL
jgi:type II secretion system protein J